MALKQESWLVNTRGQRLYTVSYTAREGRSQPRARLFWHHGLGEHIGRYDKVFMRMAEKGVNVYSLDCHGHGKSDPVSPPTDRALIMDYTYLVEDFMQYTDNVLAKSGDAGSLPLYVGGHSMGGLVACLAALQRPDLWKGLLMHSAAIDVEWTYVLRVQAAIGNWLASLVPKARVVAAVRPEDMSQDPAVVKDYVDDPLNTVGNVCARTGNEMLKAFKYAADEGPKLKLPIYAAFGTQDRCTNMAAMKRFLDRASSTDKTWNQVEGGYHDLLHGPEWMECTDRMAQWILDRSSTATSSKM